jgi:hypothetical protein
VEEVGTGGVFFRTGVLVEGGEHGTLECAGSPPVPVRVAWNRAAAGARWPGLGLAFEHTDSATERKILELILSLLDAGDHRGA